ncbi:winged helix-turn-helix transcriptional regulator [Micromonospora sp. NPDC005174]|uniref:winged helix-turn-helix transcriptional regulator n=1 Tax=unclassified Micromonospora TaxID=2617518 RepID=UPI0033A5C890
MPTTRSYGDACPIGRSLDVVGERWALLVVRELLLGPRRFSDVRRGLPGASSNLIADRLRELEGRDVIRRRKLPPPAGSWVYELTQRGRRLEPVLLALGEWGADVPRPPEPFALSATSVLLYLRTAGHPDAGAPPATYRIEFRERSVDGKPGGRNESVEIWTVRTRDGRIHVEAGGPPHADAGISTSPRAFNDLLADPSTLDAFEITGDRDALRRLVRVIP